MLLEFIIILAFFCVKAVFDLPFYGAVSLADSIQDVCSEEYVECFLWGVGKFHNLPFNGE